MNSLSIYCCLTFRSTVQNYSVLIKWFENQTEVAVWDKNPMTLILGFECWLHKWNGQYYDFETSFLCVFMSKLWDKIFVDVEEWSSNGHK